VLERAAVIGMQASPLETILLDLGEADVEGILSQAG
jgi:hypothetical protein